MSTCSLNCNYHEVSSQFQLSFEMFVDHLVLHFYQVLSYIFGQLSSASEVPCLTIYKSSLYITDTYPLCLKYFFHWTYCLSIACVNGFFFNYTSFFIIYRIKYVHFSFIGFWFSSFDYTCGSPCYFVISVISFTFTNL